jgi:hypothetical protein
MLNTFLEWYFFFFFPVYFTEHEFFMIHVFLFIFNIHLTINIANKPYGLVAFHSFFMGFNFGIKSFSFLFSFIKIKNIDYS